MIKILLTKLCLYHLHELHIRFKYLHETETHLQHNGNQLRCALDLALKRGKGNSKIIYSKFKIVIIIIYSILLGVQT